MRSIEDILKEAAVRDLRLNNLFQLETHPASPNIPPKLTGVWQANFHHPKGWHDFGKGDSPNAALEDALARAKGLKGPENRPIPKPMKVAEEETMDDLL